MLESDKILIKEWSIIDFGGNLYLAPEVLRRAIVGKVYYKPNVPDGKYIRTSPIVEVDGRKIITKSGSIYWLDGDPDPEYLKWMEENNYIYDEENPIKIIKR